MDDFSNEGNFDSANLNHSQELEPHDNMEFESKEEAFSFYKEYATSVGFEIIIKASRRSRISGKFIDAKFVCTRHGKKVDARSAGIRDSAQVMDSMLSFAPNGKRGRINRSGLKTDCKACLHVKRRQDERWIICSFAKEHNHELSPDLRYHPCGWKHSDRGKFDTDNVSAIQGRRKEIMFSMRSRSSGHEILEKKKGSAVNQVGEIKCEGFDERDAKLILSFCIHMQDENPNFFYAIDLDDKQQLKNVFWVDAKGRLDSRYFSDVVSFDTTYIRNEYKLPVLPFLGVNHHNQLVLFGCALIGNESKAAYVWLMRAWLRATGGQTPNVILTNQDEVLKQVILEVFPSSRHCFCLWHIMSQVTEKLGQVMRHSANFMKKFNKCVFQSHTNEEFEKRWWKMIETFNLQTNTWLGSLYEDRERWMPTHAKDVFLAGMSTKKRSESVNSAFDRLLLRRTNLKEFLDQYKTVLQGRLQEEARADFETWHRQPGLKSPSPFGKQMAPLYTHEIFRKFQVEVIGGVACHPRKVNEDGLVKTFLVQDFERNQDFMVVWKQQSSTISCSCRFFEFCGILCRHALIVFQISGLQKIPTQYILRRWTKDAKIRKLILLENVASSRDQRYKNICAYASKLSDEGSLSEESYDAVLNALDEALGKCDRLDKFKGKNLMVPTSCTQDRTCYDERQESSMSKISTPTKTREGETNIGTMDLGCSHGPRDAMEEVANSTSPELDEYLRSQQNIRGMVRAHWKTLSQIQGPHSIDRQRIQGMSMVGGQEQLSFRPRASPVCFDIQDTLEDTVFSELHQDQLSYRLPNLL